MVEKFSAVILAAGCGKRMNLPVPKQRILVGGCSVLFRAAAAFERCEHVSEIVVVTRNEEISEIKQSLRSFPRYQE